MTVYRCGRCGQVRFPRPAVCQGCHAPEFDELETFAGMVEQVTHLSHSAGRATGQDIWLATIRLDAGPRIIGRLAGSAAPGTPVRVNEPWDISVGDQG